MATLPTPGGDSGTWGTELNEFLSVAHGAGGLVDIGAGDAVAFYNATTPQLASLSAGTAASPDTATNPLIKVERTISVAEASVSGDGVENLSSILGIGSGTAACQTQPVGVAGFAKTASTVSTPGNDACGIYGGGNITGSGDGVGIGGFFIGRTDSTVGKISAVEMASHNGSGSNHSYTSAGFNNSQALWITSPGPHRSSAGIVFGKPGSTTQFDVGIAALAQNPILTTTIKDDGNAATSLHIAGSHATAAIHVAASAGYSSFGVTPSSASQLLVQSNDDARMAGTFMGNSATQSSSILMVQNYLGSELFSIGATGNVRVLDHNIIFGTTTGCQIGTSTSQKLAFYGSTPIVKPTVSGAKGSNVALGSLMTALANLGIVVDSTSA